LIGPWGWLLRSCPVVRCHFARSNNERGLLDLFSSLPWAGFVVGLALPIRPVRGGSVRCEQVKDRIMKPIGAVGQAQNLPLLLCVSYPVRLVSLHLFKCCTRIVLHYSLNYYLLLNFYIIGCCRLSMLLCFDQLYFRHTNISTYYVVVVEKKICFAKRK